MHHELSMHTKPILMNLCRVGTGTFAHGKVDPHSAGHAGGVTGSSGSGESTRAQGNTYKPSEHGGLKEVRVLFNEIDWSGGL